jgi:predicted DCC family thiol-disulfide oxidoreductase YuxK
VTPTVLYDGTCRFCIAQVVRLRRLTRNRVAFESAYADGVRARFPMLPSEGPDPQNPVMLGEMKFVDADGRLYGGAAAIARAFVVSGGVLGLGARLYALPPIRWAADRAYKMAAARRLKLKQTCADDNCRT